MLAGLGIENPSGSTSRLTSLLINRLRLMQVEIVFLDEIQRLCYPAVEKIRISTLAWLVDLANEFQKSIILIGTQQCSDITSYHEPFTNRFPYLVKLPFMEYDAAPTSEFHRFMKALDGVIHKLKPMKNGVHLHDAEICAAMYVASRGNLKQINIILQHVLLQCFQRPDEEGLALDDFRYVCAQLKLQLNLSKKNPFDLTLEQCRILISSSKDQPFPEGGD